MDGLMNVCEPQDRVLVFYSVRLFRVACSANRVDILQLMVTNGFDLTQSCVRDALHCIIERIEDAQAADAAQSLIRFLIQAGVDVNWQVRSTAPVADSGTDLSLLLSSARAISPLRCMWPAARTCTRSRIC